MVRTSEVKSSFLFNMKLIPIVFCRCQVEDQWKQSRRTVGHRLWKESIDSANSSKPKIGKEASRTKER